MTKIMKSLTTLRHSKAVEDIMVIEESTLHDRMTPTTMTDKRMLKSQNIR